MDQRRNKMCLSDADEECNGKALTILDTKSEIILDYGSNLRSKKRMEGYRPE